ncbi:glycosyltransferase family 2 protein [Cephaloticoccus capnophilus]|uniref:glycosyltransferase family 2 protein n=1 Tax=Cephaloticoccus capnophilus TaxID=1548208 RepID=UPI000838480A|nr:glycosyltransferase family A protein [Cephaloticoccus capnophilus]
MPPALVSILIPAYNAAQWIVETLHSALSQTHPNCEIIVVDDGSRDDTLERAKAFAANASAARIRIKSQKNAGASAARNHALRLAQGDFIQFLDADDLLAPGKIGLQLAALKKHPLLTLAMGTWGRFTTDPTQTVWAEHEAVYHARSGVEFLQLKLETHSMIQPGAWLVPRTLCERVAPWEESLSLNDDGEYFARVALQAEHLLHVPEARVHYRSAISSSLSRRRSPRALDSLYRSEQLTISHLLAANDSPRSCTAAALGWRRLAGELYPEAADLARRARQAARELGAENDTPIGVPNWVSYAARLVGWPNARRLQFLRNRFS